VTLLHGTGHGQGGSEIRFAVRGAEGHWDLVPVAVGEGLLAPRVRTAETGGIAVVWSDMRQVVNGLFASRLDALLAGAGTRIGLEWPGVAPDVSWIGEGLWALAAESEFAQILTCLVEPPRVQAVSSPHTLDERLKRDVLHAPCLGRDVHGRTWLTFIDETRRVVFGCCWQGDGWGAPKAVARIVEPTLRLTRNLAAIRRCEGPAPGADGVARMLLMPERPCVTPRLCGLPTVDSAIGAGRTILFLDLAEVQGMRGLARRMVQARKHDTNPVFAPDPSITEECRRVFNSGRVLRAADGTLRMWYAAMGERGAGNDWWNWLRTGYATSPDGVAWRRTPVGPGGSDLWTGMQYMPAIFVDPTGGERPFKWLTFDTHGQQLDVIREGRNDPRTNTIQGALWESAEGLEWASRPVELRFDGARPLSFVPQCVVVDEADSDAEHRYKAYGFSSLTLSRRGLSLATSADLVHWRAWPDNPVLDAEVRGTPLIPAGPESQIHDAVVWQQGELFLALYQYQYGADQHDTELAVSRDGRRFEFVAPGHKVIARGGPGQWDRGSIAAAVPVIDEDTIRIYYGGTDYHHPSDGPYTFQRSDSMTVACGLATLRRDGFAYLTPADGDVGVVETIAFGPLREPHGLTANADLPDDCLATGEILDPAHGKPIEGYGAQSAVPVRGDSLAHRMEWDGRQRLPLGRPFRVRVAMRGATDRARLYGIGVEAEP